MANEVQKSPDDAPPVSPLPEVTKKPSHVTVRQYIVPEGYRGRSTKEFYVEEGTWDEDAPELNGLGDTLVALGKASVSERKIRVKNNED